MYNRHDIENFSNKYRQIREEIAKEMIGQDAVVEHLLLAVIAGGNVLLEGVPGLGKTHLCSAIAKKVIDSGYDVLYVSAIDLFADFEKERFGNSAAEGTGTDMRRYTHCDLLIIDDLGTEVINKFTTSTLYNIINTRLIHRKATILNTNFTVEEFQKQYWDRITSRVFTEYICMHFVGSDIRAQKLNRR